MDEYKLERDNLEQFLISYKNSYYKVLCLFEEKNEGLFKYIDSLIVQTYGLQYVDIQNKHILITLISILESLLDESICTEYDLKMVKREIFKCFDLIEKLEGGD